MGSAIIVAVVVGAGVAIQVAVLGRAAERIHALAVSLALQMAGVMVGLAWASMVRGWSDVGRSVVAWWWLPLGAFGWMLVGGLGYASRTLGVSLTLGIAVTVQLVVGYGLDVRAGRAPLEPQALAGLALVIVGLTVFATRAT